MSNRMYGLTKQLVSSVKDERQRVRCASAIRQHNQALWLISRGEYQDAIRANEEALGLIQDIPKVAVLRALCQAATGMALFQLEQHDESQSINLEALPVLLAHQNYANEAATCLNIIGGSLVCQGRAAESIKPFKDAIGIWSQIPGNEQKISDCKENLVLAKRTAAKANAQARKPWWKFW